MSRHAAHRQGGIRFWDRFRGLSDLQTALLLVIVVYLPVVLAVVL